MSCQTCCCLSSWLRDESVMHTQPPVAQHRAATPKRGVERAKGSLKLSPTTLADSRTATDAGASCQFCSPGGCWDWRPWLQQQPLQAVHAECTREQPCSCTHVQEPAGKSAAQLDEEDEEALAEMREEGLAEASAEDRVKEVDPGTRRVRRIITLNATKEPAAQQTRELIFTGKEEVCAACPAPAAAPAAGMRMPPPV